MSDNLNHARPTPSPNIFRAAPRLDQSVEHFFVFWNDPTTRNADDDRDALLRLTQLIHGDMDRLVAECIAAMGAYPLACLRFAEALIADGEQGIAFFFPISIDDTAIFLREIDAQDPMLSAELLRVITAHAPMHAMALYNTITQAERGGVSAYHSFDVTSGYNSIDGINLSEPVMPLTYKFLL